MFLPIYLAMTGREIAQYSGFSSTLCYMACHFSSSGPGLSNLPSHLPEGTILCIDDSTPIQNHNVNLITKQINELCKRVKSDSILLDFQRPDNPFAQDMVDSILESAPCPVAVSHIYAKDFDCPVFLPPLPFRLPLSAYLEPWNGKEVWLELGADKEMAIITEAGFGAERVHYIPEGSPYFRDSSLLCHYCTHIKQDHIAVYFHRTKRDMEELQQHAHQLGVCKFIGLLQQLQQFYSPA